jgi:hypothetical protein
MVRCRGCRRLFRARLQVDRSSLEAMVIEAEYTCPWCGLTATYVKADHHPILEEG